MATLRELKGRIGSVASTEKITGAMKMISSAKMHKAEQALKRLVPYRSQLETIMGNLLGADADFSSPLLDTSREVNRVAVVVFGSDDGLCGAFNINILKVLVSHIAEIKERYSSAEIVIYPVGCKMLKAVDRLIRKENNIRIETLEGVDSHTAGAGVKSFVDHLCHEFVVGHFDRVFTLYMNFQSAGRQRPKYEQLLPVSTETFADNGVKSGTQPYLFEPNPQEIFSSLLPMFLVSVMQEIFPENRASEQAARVMAMQSANDNAQKLLEQLQLEFNKLRQQSITTELLDILGGQVR